MTITSEESIALAIVLTLALVPVALARAKDSPSFAMMALGWVGMFWRAEAWQANAIDLKEDFRSLSEQLSQCQQSQSNTESNCAPYDQFRGLADQSYCSLLYRRYVSDPIVYEPLQASASGSAIATEKSLTALFRSPDIATRLVAQDHPLPPI